jgi:probable rRNA maturation factor
MKFLFTHGMLHLLGYDHQSPDDEAVMIALQKSILDKEKKNG